MLVHTDIVDQSNYSPEIISWNQKFMAIGEHLFFCTIMAENNKTRQTPRIYMYMLIYKQKWIYFQFALILLAWPLILPFGSSGGSHVAMTAVPFPLSGLTSKFSGGPDGAGKWGEHIWKERQQWKEEQQDRNQKQHRGNRVRKLLLKACKKKRVPGGFNWGKYYCHTLLGRSPWDHVWDCRWKSELWARQ